MKLSKKKLKELRELVQKRNEAYQAIGTIEMRKSQVLAEAYQIEEEYQQIRISLQEKYGKDVQIDMDSGDIQNASNNLKKT